MSKKILRSSAALLLVVVSFLPGLIPPEPVEAISSGANLTWLCIRHGFRDTRDCGWGNAYFGGSGYDRFSMDYDISGHRHGSSGIRAIACLVASSGSGGECRSFSGSGDALGYEYGGQHPYIPYASGNITINSSNMHHMSFYAWVEDAEVRVYGSGQARGSDPPSEAGYECPSGTIPRGNDCLPSCGDAGGNTCSYEICRGGGHAILPSYDCGDCCNTEGYGQGYYQGGYGPVEGYYEGYYQGYYESYYQSYYESYYQATYNYTSCTADGDCATLIANEPRANGCGSEFDCPQPPPTCSSFTATPDKIVPPRTTTVLNWTCRKAHNGCSITGVGPVPESGSRTVTPATTLDYVLTCSGRGGNSIEYRTTVRKYEFEGGQLREIPPS